MSSAIRTAICDLLEIEYPILQCIAHPDFKQKILTSQDRVTVVTGQSTGHPVRCLKNKLARQFLEMERRGASVEDLEKLGEGKLYLGVTKGDLVNGSLMAGQIAGMGKEIKPVRDIIKEMVTQAEEILGKLGAKVGEHI